MGSFRHVGGFQLVFVKTSKSLCKNPKKQRWIRPLLQLTNQIHLLKIWTNPRNLVVLSSRWRWSMALTCLLASTLMIVVSRTDRVKFLVLPRNPRRLPRPDLNNLHILRDIMLWI